MINDLEIIENIRRRLQLRKNLATACVLILVFGFASFLFYGLETSSNAIKIISKKDDIGKVEKIMMNPRIKYEHNQGEIFDIQAARIVHKNVSDMELFDVKATGIKGDIQAGSLLITNNGNDLHFSGNPILTIREYK